MSEILPPKLAITAMRDSGYRNTAYALAELIDNSVQAKASLVEVFCLEVREIVATRERKRIKKIAVLDSGDGMDADTLRMALQFGNGTKLKDRSGIGRFGMGLPNASISQCKLIQIWTWQNGPDNALYSYLDVNKMEDGDLREVPAPIHSPVPAEWRERSCGINNSGTLVVWDELEEQRLTWKTARATFENTEILAGRMYRKFISKGNLRLRLAAFENGNKTYDKDALVNDPLYLMAPSSTPAPYNTVTMFQKWGEQDYEYEIDWQGSKHVITVRASWAKLDTVPQDGTDRGRTLYGKHAAKNIGVSIVRADRELDLDDSWAIGYDPVERWWGVEVDFPAALDEIFGVTNNKQSANIFSHMAHFDWELEANEGESFTEFKDRLIAEGDHRVFLLEIVYYIKDQLVEIRKKLKDQTKGNRSGGKRHDDTAVDDRASSMFRQRKEEGHVTEQDGIDPDESAYEALKEDLINAKNYPPTVADEITTAARVRNRKVLFVEADNDSNAFFSIEQRAGGITEIVLNRQHPAYDNLISALNKDVARDTTTDLIARIENSSETLMMLFAAWARYEMEDIPNRTRIKDMRQDWGKMARIFLNESED